MGSRFGSNILNFILVRELKMNKKFAMHHHFSFYINRDDPFCLNFETKKLHHHYNNHDEEVYKNST